MTTPTPAIPAFDHIFVVIMENHGYDEIIGSADAPYLNQLATQCGSPPTTPPSPIRACPTTSR